jgi:ABC-type spermidine/putrescine transport system permease subunit I
MILPLFAGLDRIAASTLEEPRDLGAGRSQTFLFVTLPLSRQAILAGTIIVMLPMVGDYYTQVLLASTRNTSMLGNLIVSSMQSSLVQRGASLALLVNAAAHRADALLHARQSYGPAALLAGNAPVRVASPSRLPPSPPVAGHIGECGRRVRGLD